MPNEVVTVTPEIIDLGSRFAKNIACDQINQIQDILPLPEDTILFGFADDGLPLLLKVNEPETGPILILGKSCSGKTALLQSIALGLSYTHSPAMIQFAVITPNTFNWVAQADSPYCAGIYSLQSDRACRALKALEIWQHYKRRDKMLILFVDGLEFANFLNAIARNLLARLFQNGSTYGIWPIVTANSDRPTENKAWLSLFATTIFCLQNEITGRSAYIINDAEGLLKFNGIR